MGEALVSVLDERGAPTVVERALVYPPESRLGVVTADERRDIVRRSPVYGQYEEAVDRESAYERLTERVKREEREEEREAEERRAAKERARSSGGRRDNLAEAMAKSAARAVGSRIGREIVRGLLGVIFGGRK